MLGKRYFSTSVLFMVLCLVFVCSSSVAFAAGNLDLFQAQNDAKSLADVGLGNNAFQGNLQSISQGIVTMARIIATTFIALGGIMVAFNVESANKLLWNVMLGVGLALNFFIVIGSLYTTNGLVGTTEPFSYKFNLANGDTPWYNFVSDFTREYENFCKEGARVIVPIAAKLLLCLTAINGSLKVALGMVSGDKMKFLIETLVTTGFYLFLIMNWFNGDYTTASGDKMSSGMNLMGSLMEGFRSIGQQAGGFTDGSAPTNDIIGIACKMFLAGVGEGGGALSITSPIMSLATLIALFAMVVLLFLTGLEMVMARIEFVTLAMISIIMIPWGALKQTSFLFESALRAMFNLAIKVSVIAFIEAMSCTILTQYCEQFTQAAGNNKILGNFTLLLQVVFISIMLYFITKKIPELASSMISGNPSLGAASMVATAKNVSHAAVKGGAAVASGGAAVAAAGARGAVTAGGAAAGKAAAGGASAASIAAAGIKGGALGALNAMGGAAVSGTAGLAKRSLLGTKNQDGSRSGGLLSGAVNAALQGKDIGQAYVPKGGKLRRLSTAFPKPENVKNAVGKAMDAAKHPEKTVANAVKNTQTVKSVQDAYRISQVLNNKGKGKK